MAWCQSSIGRQQKFKKFHQQVRFYLKNDNNKIFLIGDVNEQSGNKSSSPLSERRRTAPYLGIRVPIRFFNLDFFFHPKNSRPLHRHHHNVILFFFSKMTSSSTFSDAPSWFPSWTYKYVVLSTFYIMLWGEDSKG